MTASVVVALLRSESSGTGAENVGSGSGDGRYGRPTAGILLSRSVRVERAGRDRTR